MRSTALLLIGVATVCGMIASIAVSQLTGRPVAKNVRSTVRQRIYVAQHDVAPGQPLSEDNLRLESWEVDSIPPAALLRLEDALGKVCRDRLKPGDPVQVSALAAPAEKTAPAITMAVPVPQTPVPQTPVNQASIAQSPASESPAAPVPSVPTAASAAKPLEAVAESAEAASPPVENGEAIRVSPPTVTATDPPHDREPSRSSEALNADKHVGSAAKMGEATPQTSGTKLAAPTNISASGLITDEGWVMTIYKSGGVKVLRWRPTSDSSSVQPRGAAVEQSARPTSEPKKS